MRIPKPVVYCPKCNLESVGVVCLNPPEPERYSIDELPLRRRIVQTVRANLRWLATCKNCGYAKEYSDTEVEMAAKQTIIAGWLSTFPCRDGIATMEDAKCCPGLVYRRCDRAGDTQWADYEWGVLDCGTVVILKNREPTEGNER